MHEMITSHCTWRNFMTDPLGTIQDLFRLKEDLQRLLALSEYRSYFGAEVLKIVRQAVNY